MVPLVVVAFENCFGADGKLASRKRNLDQADVYETPEEKEKKLSEMSPTEFVIWKRDKRIEKMRAKEERESTRKNHAEGECSDDGKAEN